MGLGTQDSFSQAQDFVSDTGTQTIDMLWDSSGTSWIRLGARGQPSWMLLDANGQTLINVRFGAIDESSVLQTLSS